jgi:hypothetical protein
MLVVRALRPHHLASHRSWQNDATLTVMTIMRRQPIISLPLPETHRMALGRNRLPAYPWCALLAIALSGCSTDTAVGPEQHVRSSPSKPNLDLTTVTLPVPSSSGGPTFGGVQPIGTGYRLLPWEHARVRVTGGVQMSDNLACNPNATPFDVSPNGPDGSAFTGEFEVLVAPVDSSVTPVLSNAGSFWAQSADGNGWVTYSGNGYTDRSVYLWIGRTAFRERYCGPFEGGTPVPAYQLSGSQTATIEPIVFKPIPSTEEFSAGDSVNFTLAVSNVSPIDIKWGWKLPSATFAQPFPACAGQTTCKVAPTGTGTMLVTAHIQENPSSFYIETSSVQVVQRLPECETPVDSLLNNLTVRGWLRDMLDSSKAWGPIADRREKAGGIYRNVETGELHMFYDQFQRATPCSVFSFNFIGPPNPPYVLIAFVHTHPYSGSTETRRADVAPNNCAPHQRGREANERGASPADWNYAWNKHVPGIYISQHYMGRFNAHLPETRDPSKRMMNTSLARWNWDGSNPCLARGMRPPPVIG